MLQAVTPNAPCKVCGKAFIRFSSFESAEEVRAFLDYEAMTGFLYWRAGRGRRIGGKRAGFAMADGYWAVMLKRRRIGAHILVWAWNHGRWPEGVIDHIDHDRGNNRIENLRDVSPSINSQNRSGPEKFNKSGYLGVTARPDGKFEAKIHAGGKDFYLGRYATAHEAHTVYQAAKKLHHPGVSKC